MFCFLHLLRIFLTLSFPHFITYVEDSAKFYQEEFNRSVKDQPSAALIEQDVGLVLPYPLQPLPVPGVGHTSRKISGKLSPNYLFY